MKNIYNMQSPGESQEMMQDKTYVCVGGLHDGDVRDATTRRRRDRKLFIMVAAVMTLSIFSSKVPAWKERYI